MYFCWLELLWDSGPCWVSRCPLLLGSQAWLQHPQEAIPSDLYVAMKDVGLVGCGAGGRVQQQSTAIGYLEAQHRTLGWVAAPGAPEEGGGA